MKFYNTLTRKKEEFVPIEEGKVKMYVCGPTVYNLIHIGNARPMIVFDTLRRYMEYKGYEVNYVSNFTDVDDKIIKAAIEEGVDSDVISTRYIAECKKDMAEMNIKPATVHPQATKEIGGMIKMIKTLIEKGYAYNVDGTVYFRTRKFSEYGKLSHKNIEDLESGHRKEKEAIKVSGENEKEDPLDFVLWKPKKEGEPFWKSPWSDGRPGWHIECSVMAGKYLGETIDIHGGGEDLVFPHHENEIAQSECCNGVTFANYWLHNAFLQVDGTKMSKSLGNFFTVRDICKEYSGQVLRFFTLSGHYRSPLNFADKIIEGAANSLNRITTAADKIRNVYKAAKDGNISENEAKKLEDMKAFRTKFENAMDDDINTADAITAIFDLVKFANIEVTSEGTKAFAQAVLDELTLLCDILGIKLEEKKEELSPELMALIEERTAAKWAKDFAKADEIRAELLKKGIEIKDTREGVQWKRV